MIIIQSHQSTWRNEFLALGSNLRQVLGELALRIDHIGSTSVPGLAAKDIIDIQITVPTLEPTIVSLLAKIGYHQIQQITQDHLPPGASQTSGWVKWLFKPSSSHRPVNVHVRVAGQPNQRYALLFRDYLRTHPTSVQAYAHVKLALAKYHADNVEAYYDVKDPVCDLIMGGAEIWAVATLWQPSPTDC
ncbi:GrpB family protein [Pantanalinema sp. GBBB05]|uniref:GrpB family protein n=1 Tax=Pantanalinema sp. GBBB05 TaxID=2604139 RepID=UPI001DFC853D|nr:GrpB family protein [Pantanalinema sp. GBBB05]